MMKRKTIMLSLLCFALILTSCARNSGGKTETMTAMDTVMSITIYENEEEGVRLFRSLLSDLDEKWNPADSESEIARFNNDRDLSALSADTKELLLRSIEFSEETDGNLDITLYPLTRLWGFETEEPKRPSDSLISLLLSECGTEHIQVEGDEISLGEYTMLDLGATAKGYAADLLAEQLLESGCNSAILSLGGNVRTIGAKPDGSDWKVALTDPFDPADTFAHLSVKGDMSIVTSGSYQRYFEEDGVRYCHIFDPETGYPVDNDLVSVTIVCKEGIRADAFSTAAFVMGSVDAEAFYRSHDDFEMILVLDDGTVKVSEGLKGGFCLSDAENKFQVIER